MQRGRKPAFLRKILFAATFSLFTGQAIFATQFTYTFHEDGASESPAQATNGTGDGSIVYDNSAHTLAISISFSGLNGVVTQTHFHAATTVSGLPGPGQSPDDAAHNAGTTGIAIGNPSLPGFPLGGTSGTYTNTLDLTQASVYNSTYLAANGGTAASAESSFIAALQAGKVYENIHSQFAAGGEIRGFPALVPEPTGVALAGLGLGALSRRRRK
jgi:hypothetical protein